MAWPSAMVRWSLSILRCSAVGGAEPGSIAMAKSSQRSRHRCDAPLFSVSCDGVPESLAE